MLLQSGLAVLLNVVMNSKPDAIDRKQRLFESFAASYVRSSTYKLSIIGRIIADLWMITAARHALVVNCQHRIAEVGCIALLSSIVLDFGDSCFQGSAYFLNITLKDLLAER